MAISTSTMCADFDRDAFLKLANIALGACCAGVSTAITLSTGLHHHSNEISGVDNRYLIGKTSLNRHVQHLAETAPQGGVGIKKCVHSMMLVEWSNWLVVDRTRYRFMV